ncbi:MAG: DUF3489 domain-containing protein [Rhodoplanes sp.]
MSLPSHLDCRAAQAGATHRHASPAKGATIEEIAEALSWQPHTVRGAIAGALKKKLGLEVTSEKDEKRGRVYRVTI